MRQQGGPEDYYAKWNKHIRERQTPYDLTYIQNMINKVSYKQNRNWSIGIWNSCQGGGDEGVGEKLKGLSKKALYITHGHRQQYGDNHRESRIREV